jgi:putative membrane protein
MYVPDGRSWIAIVFQLRGTALPRIWHRIAFVTATATLLTYVHERYPGSFVTLTTTPFLLIGVPLGVFLGFRNNTSYDRFWEGRKLWGSLVNTSRSFTRQVLTFIEAKPEDGGAEPDAGAMRAVSRLQREVVHETIAYVHAFRMALRDEPPFETLRTLLPSEVVDALRDERNVPIAILQRIGSRLQEARRRGWLDPLHAPLLEGSLTAFTDIQGGCERIKATPVPFSYTVFLHRIVAIYCFLLPFGIVDTIGPLTPVVVAFIAYAFFALDSIGGEIENPFGLDVNDLPLYQISRLIETNLRQRLGESALPEPVRPHEGILI